MPPEVVTKPMRGPFGSRPPSKVSARFEHVVERAAIADAVALAHRQIGRVVAADGAGMRLRRRARFLRGAGLDRHDRFAGFERATGRRA